jgi:hypothetical protein
MTDPAHSPWHRWKDADEAKPEAPGWYPTLWVMPDNEGIMPGSAKWDGNGWDSNTVDYFIDETHPSAEAARDVARLNDVET